MGRRKERQALSKKQREIDEKQKFALSFASPFEWFKATQKLEGKVEVPIAYVLFLHSYNPTPNCSQSGKMFNLRYDGTVNQINQILQANPIKCEECNEVLKHDTPIPTTEWRQKS